MGRKAKIRAFRKTDENFIQTESEHLSYDRFEITEMESDPHWERMEISIDPTAEFWVNWQTMTGRAYGDPDKCREYVQLWRSSIERVIGEVRERRTD